MNQYPTKVTLVAVVCAVLFVCRLTHASPRCTPGSMACPVGGRSFITKQVQYSLVFVNPQFYVESTAHIELYWV